MRQSSKAVKVQPFVGNPLGTLACFKFYPLFSKELQLLSVVLFEPSFALVPNKVF